VCLQNAGGFKDFNLDQRDRREPGLSAFPAFQEGTGIRCLPFQRRQKLDSPDILSLIHIFHCDGWTEVISQNGARIRMRQNPAPDQEITIHYLETGKEAVVRVPPILAGAIMLFSVEYIGQQTWKSPSRRGLMRAHPTDLFGQMVNPPQDFLILAFLALFFLFDKCE
jgi:hypothetical protein